MVVIAAAKTITGNQALITGGYSLARHAADFFQMRAAGWWSSARK